MTGVNTLPEINNTTDTIKSLIDELKNEKPLTTELLNLTWAPTWINNVTRLNAQNLQEKLYNCLKDNYTNASNTTVKVAYEQIQRVLNFVAGVKPDSQSTSEIHNNNPGFNPANNTAAGNYQSIFGKGNSGNETVDGQFIIGTYANSTDGNSLFIVGVGTTPEGRDNAVVINTDGKTTFYKDVDIRSSLEVPKITITGDIEEDSDATTKKYVDTAIKNVNAISIKNVDAAPITATLANVQDTATKYIADNYGGRDPENLDGLIITITDGPSGKPDRILFVYSNITNAWVNAGINDVDLSNYYVKEQVYNKDEINTMLEWHNW